MLRTFSYLLLTLGTLAALSACEDPTQKSTPTEPSTAKAPSVQTDKTEVETLRDALCRSKDELTVDALSNFLPATNQVIWGDDWCSQADDGTCHTGIEKVDPTTRGEEFVSRVELALCDANARCDEVECRGAFSHIANHVVILERADGTPMIAGIYQSAAMVTHGASIEIRQKMDAWRREIVAHFSEAAQRSGLEAPVEKNPAELVASVVCPEGDRVAGDDESTQFYSALRPFLAESARITLGAHQCSDTDGAGKDCTTVVETIKSTDDIPLVAQRITAALCADNRTCDDRGLRCEAAGAQQHVTIIRLREVEDALPAVVGLFIKQSIAEGSPEKNENILAKWRDTIVEEFSQTVERDASHENSDVSVAK